MEFCQSERVGTLRKEARKDARIPGALTTEYFVMYRIEQHYMASIQYECASQVENNTAAAASAVSFQSKFPF